MPYDPKANIGRFVTVGMDANGEVAGLIQHPTEDRIDPANELLLTAWLEMEQEHNSRMPPDLKFNSGVQIREIVKALTAVQDYKIARGIPLDTQRSVHESAHNVVSFPQPVF